MNVQRDTSGNGGQNQAADQVHSSRQALGQKKIPRHRGPRTILCSTCEFLDKAIGVVDPAQRFEDRRGMNRDGAGLLFCVSEVEDQ